MDRAQLRARLFATFVAELDEHAHTLGGEAQELQKDTGARRAEILQSLFRAAHSLKGAARSAGVLPVEALCHRLEETLARARDEDTAPADLPALLLQAADALGHAGARLRAQEDPAAGPLGALLEHLSASPAAAPAQPALPPLPALPGPPARPGVQAAAEAPARAPGRAPSIDRFIRLPAATLDDLVARSGELLLARRRASIRNQEVGELSDLVSGCRVELRRASALLRSTGAIAPGGPSHAVAASLGPTPRTAAQAVTRAEQELKGLDRGLARLASALARDEREIGQAASALEDGLRQLRMSPFGEACEALERAARDLAAASGKEVRVAVEGGDIDVDRAVLDALRDPLRHLLRNAIDHGLEPPAERLSRGKPRHGTVTVAAAVRGQSVQIDVADDGRGLDVRAIRARAGGPGRPGPAEDPDPARLIFQPGFSTARAVTELSGRGVGLDVVKHAVEALHGSVQVTFEPGRGARFSLLVPLTLTTLRALLVVAGGRTYALPSSGVERLVRVRGDELASVDGRDALVLGEGPVVAASLASLLQLGTAERPAAGAKMPFVVLSAGGRRAALAVDELLAEQETIVKGLGPRLRRVRHLTGTTVLASGDLALILSPSDLVEAALARAPAGALLMPPAEAARPRRRLLVADDSVTTRGLVKSILEGAGFDVVEAPDGARAWQILQAGGADLVVSDVEMPKMDGFQLTRSIRASARFRDLPVVLVTALQSEADHARGLDAGADAYLPKGTFDQGRLLDVVKELLGDLP